MRVTWCKSWTAAKSLTHQRPSVVLALCKYDLGHTMHALQWHLQILSQIDSGGAGQWSSLCFSTLTAWGGKTQRLYTPNTMLNIVFSMAIRRSEPCYDPIHTHSYMPAVQDCFEVGRRYKIMNPDRMRSDYGKLMYLLMDASDPDIQDLLEFNCIRPLRTGQFLAYMPAHVQ